MRQLLLRCRDCDQTLTAPTGEMGATLEAAGWRMVAGQTLCRSCGQGSTSPSPAPGAVAPGAVAGGTAPIRPLDPAVGGPSITGLRAAAVLIDGLLLLPIIAIALALLWLLFPHDGFVIPHASTDGSGVVGVALIGPGGLLMGIALSLSYFLILEARSGQTVGKRKMGLRVVTTEGELASANAIAGRTLLRLIDGIGFYLVGFVVALLSGPRRRRLGDLAAGTMVVRTTDVPAPAPRTPGPAARLYPVAWIATVLAVTLGLGLGAAVDRAQRAYDVVQAYVKARAAGDGARACSLLSRDQQRELVAAETGNYDGARSSRCPSLILGTNSNSTLLNPDLAVAAAGPLDAKRGPGGTIVLRSADHPRLALIAIQEDGRIVLDVRGLDKASFVGACSASGRGSVLSCLCVYEWLRAQHELDGSPDELTGQYTFTQALSDDRARCASNPLVIPV